MYYYMMRSYARPDRLTWVLDLVGDMVVDIVMGVFVYVGVRC